MVSGKYFSLALLFAASVQLAAQDPPSTREEFEKNYGRRIQQEYLNGVYIPSDMEDAFQTLNELIDDESRKKFKNMAEEDAATKLHFSLGRWIIHNWGFYEGSRFSHYLRSKLSLSYPDDMAQFVIVTYHRNLNRRPLEIQSLVSHYREKRDSMYQKYLDEGTILKEWVRKREKGGS